MKRHLFPRGQTAMRSAIEVANWLILNGAGFDLTHLKIQKLLYVAFAAHVVDHDEHLFYDPIEAWKFGPVVQSVYHHLKFFGSDVIGSPIEVLDGVIPVVPTDERTVTSSLQETLEVFGRKPASELVRWTHTVGGPWDETYDREAMGFQEISKAKIKSYFSKACGEAAGRPRLVKNHPKKDRTAI